MKYKVGDSVKVRGDLEVDKIYGDRGFTDAMKRYKGEVVKIKQVYRNAYFLERDAGKWLWNDEMLEPVQELELDIKNLIGKAIHCNTENKANQLLEFLGRHGYMWTVTYKKPTEKNNWNVYTVNTCYRIYEDKTITYDSIKYFKDTNYDIIEFDDLIQSKTQDKPLICEIIGKNVNEKFNIKNYGANPCFINIEGIIKNQQLIHISYKTLMQIINNPNLIEDIPKITYTEKQINAFKSLVELFKLKFVARDKEGSLWGYVEKPVRHCDVWEYGANIVDLDALDKEIFDFIKWEDAEPFDLVKSLEVIEKQ